MLYLRQKTDNAAPKCISGRTSYLRVRLAFHPYPQVIPAFCNRLGFGPPRACSARFTLPKGSHTVSGLTRATRRQVVTRLIQTRFRCASATEWLKPQRRLTRRLILQKARRHALHHKGAIALRLLVGDAVSGTVSPPSRGAFHLSLTVLFRYRWQRVFSLRRWSSQIPTGFLVPRGTRVPERSPSFSPTGLSPPMVGLPRPFG